MKVFLVVAQGVHAGKQIPVVGTEFLIGRDPACNLRPASPAISKQHCSIRIAGDSVFVRDYGSTNGTYLNEEQIAGERQAKPGDLLKVGPLEFKLAFEATAQVPALKVAPAPSATSAAASGATVTATAASVATVKAAPAKPVTKSIMDDFKPTTNSPTIIAEGGSVAGDDPDSLAAMLLMEDDGSSNPTINAMGDATTVMEMPAVGPKGLEAAAAGEKKKDEKKGHADSSSAAADALAKYMRRPRT
jgi:pSer/pThr/pTyr-binding forkhead associated (FHA) protein